MKVGDDPVSIRLEVSDPDSDTRVSNIVFNGVEISFDVSGDARFNRRNQGRELVCIHMRKTKQ